MAWVCKTQSEDRVETFARDSRNIHTRGEADGRRRECRECSWKATLDGMHTAVLVSMVPVKAREAHPSLRKWGVRSDPPLLPRGIIEN